MNDKEVGEVDEETKTDEEPIRKRMVRTLDDEVIENRKKVYHKTSKRNTEFEKKRLLNRKRLKIMLLKGSLLK